VHDLNSCDKLAFDGLDTTHSKYENYLRDDIIDSKACENLCAAQSESKMYIHNKQNRQCRCLTTILSEFENHVIKVGAPKGCLAQFSRDSCVSD
jgi:hypothetical protein